VPPGAASDPATPFTTAGRAAVKVWADQYFQSVAGALEQDGYPSPTALHLDTEVYTGGSADWIALGLADPRAATDVVAFSSDTFDAVWGAGFVYDFAKGFYDPSNQRLMEFSEGYYMRQLDFALLEGVVEPARAVWGAMLPFSNYGVSCGTPSAPVPGSKPYLGVTDVPQIGADYQTVVMQPVCGYYWHQDGRGTDGGLTRAVKDFIGDAQLADMTQPLSAVLRQVFKARARKSVEQALQAQSECGRPVLAWTAFPGMEVRFRAGPTLLGSFVNDPYALALAAAHPGDIADCAAPGEGVTDVCGSCIGQNINGQCVSDGFQCVGYTVTVEDIAETVNTACQLGVRDFAFWGAEMAAFADVMKLLPDCP
jgi:hypothetical protein